MNDFKQTVDLKEKFKRASVGKPPAGKNKPSPTASKPAASFEAKRKSSASQPGEYGKSKQAKKLDRFYNEEKNEKFDYKKISRPKARQINEKIYKRIIIILAVLLVAALVYGLFLKKNNKSSSPVNKEPVWYAVKLTNNETYYGQITDVTADPVVISNVYYNYDQLADNTAEKPKTNNLRLVKRGKEAAGPTGTMDIIRSQIVYMEPLSQDSKVLKAILDYEK